MALKHICFSSMTFLLTKSLSLYEKVKLLGLRFEDNQLSYKYETTSLKAIFI